MKVVHLCLACFFPDAFSYQENLLPKYHKDLGYDVEVIASLESFNKDGKFIILEPCKPYINEYGIKVTRLEYKYNNKFAKKIKIYKNTYNTIRNAKPDILFIHGLQFWDMHEVVRYLKEHRNVSVFVDNHADFSNSATNWLSLNILHKILWKHCAHIINDYTKKFFGVLPARVDFLEQVYNLPETKCELLVMGADDEEVERTSSNANQIEVKRRLGIREGDFVIVTGGKIDGWKKQTLLLMEAVNKIHKDNIKLLIFGPVAEEIVASFDLLMNENIIHIPWADAKSSYDYFSIADLVVFPGRHSVYWEQAAGCGKPMICKYWQGTTHVDMGGNVIFLYNDSVDEIMKNISHLYCDNESLSKMQKIAESTGKSFFSYRQIAKRSLQ